MVERDGREFWLESERSTVDGDEIVIKDETDIDDDSNVLVTDEDTIRPDNIASVDPEIEDWHDLDAARTEPDGEYFLVNDLDSTTAGYDEHVDDPEEGWEPIDSFNGELDGDGYEIQDLVIDRPGEQIVGLIRTNDGTVENLGVVDADVVGEGGMYGEGVGILAGRSNGEVLNCYSTGSVEGNHYHRDCVGGLLGTNDGDVIDCHSSATVSADESAAGGLVGNHIGGIILRSYATGDVTAKARSGGLVGKFTGAVIEESFAAGDVTATEDTSDTGDDVYPGGLVGFMHNADVSEVRDVYALGDVTAEVSPGAGGLFGRNGSSDAEPAVARTYAVGDVDAEGDAGGITATSMGDIGDTYWDRGTTNQSSGGDSGTEGFGSTDDTTPADEMQGTEAETNMTGLDFDDDEIWATTEAADGDATADGYPILTNVDREAQLEAQDILAE